MITLTLSPWVLGLVLLLLWGYLGRRMLYIYLLSDLEAPTWAEMGFIFFAGPIVWMECLVLWVRARRANREVKK